MAPNDGFASWAVAKAEIDLRVGGDMRTSYNPDSTLDDEHTIVNRIISFEPERMLSIQNVRAPAGFPNAQLFQNTWSVVYFQPQGLHHTHVRIVGLGYGEGPEWDAIYSMFKSGNHWTLDRLRDKFAEARGAIEADADEAIMLLSKFVGGDWIVEGRAHDGSTFRVRNRIEFGPTRNTLMTRGWFGDDGGMDLHAVTQIWREPPTAPHQPPGPVRFQVLSASGGIVRGEIHRTGANQLEWDWSATDLNGRTVHNIVRTTLEDENRYRMTVQSVPASDPANTQDGATLVFTRVQELPAEFQKIRETK